MKYKLKTSHEIKSNFLIELLKDRNIDVGNEKFFNPTFENELPPEKLDHMKEAYELMKHHVLNGKRIFIVVD